MLTREIICKPYLALNDHEENEESADPGHNVGHRHEDRLVVDRVCVRTVKRVALKRQENTF